MGENLIYKETLSQCQTLIIMASWYQSVAQSVGNVRLLVNLVKGHKALGVKLRGVSYALERT